MSDEMGGYRRFRSEQNALLLIFTGFTCKVAEEPITELYVLKRSLLCFHQTSLTSSLVITAVGLGKKNLKWASRN